MFSLFRRSHEIYYRYDEPIEKCRRDESAENDNCHGALYLIAWLVAADDHWYESESRSEGRHHDGVESVGRTDKHTVLG